jgi:hypothetical protein
MPRSAPVRLALLALVVGSAVAASATGTTPRTPADVTAAPGACPTGYVLERDTDLVSFSQGQRGSCLPAVHRESSKDLALANGQRTSQAQAPYGVQDGAYAAGTAQALALAAQATTTSAAWKQLGKTPLIANGADYGEVNQEGFVHLSGRIEDFSFVPRQRGHWFASLANGGVHETTDSGAHWTSIGDGLPTQITGTVLYTAGRVIVGTGDPAFGGSSLSGLGAYWTDDHGKTWVHSKGVPSGALSFQLAVDPNHSNVVYLASSKGLYRSADRGVSFTNVVLPTTCTSLTDANCFFANIVTDVVVQAKGGSANAPGGAVLAAVGWRAGQTLNAKGKQQSPQNGLYTSTTGLKSSFHFIDPLGTAIPNVSNTGFPGAQYLGRISLGIASGATQNHGYVYAVVEDAEKFNGNACALDVNDGGITDIAIPGICAAGTVLNGIYGSSDLGQTWTRLADSTSLASPAAQSALVGPGAISYAPGVQSWYNSWITPDPSANLTDLVTGAPTHLVFGLEEVWQNTTADTGSSATLSPILIVPAGSPAQLPQTTQFQTLGRYYGGQSCYGLVATLPVPCGTNILHTGATSTHPDQHAGVFVPDPGETGVTLLVGNDGGAYAQHTTGTAIASQEGWGDGVQGSGSGVLHTLLPYEASMAKDGTVYAGLQDNGELKITPDGSQYETFGGDGFYSSVDPNNSKVAYEEYTGGAVSVTQDGGKTWSSIDPGLTAGLFATPFVMDPKDARHLLIGGRDIYERFTGPTGNWRKVYDLGTRKQPGNAAAVADTSDVNNANANNSLSAVDLNGDNAYVGFCGACDIVTGTRPFHSGIATNVKSTGTGWHIAKAIGLPQRYVTSVKMDPANRRTVYATVGGYGRRWIPPGALNDDTSKVGTGHLFVSHDAGEHFTDISGNLPDLPANTSLLFRGLLLVGTDNGVFATSAAKPGTYASFAKGMPTSPVVSLKVTPRNPREIVAANFGRGVLTLVVPVKEPSTNPPPVKTPGGGTKGPLAATGLPVGLGVLALLVLGSALVLRRRLHRP